MTDPHDDMMALCRAATGTDGELLFKSVEDDERDESELSGAPYAIVLVTDGQFKRLARYRFGLTTTVDVAIIAPENATDGYLTRLRDALVSYILNTPGKLDWTPTRFSRHRFPGLGGQPLAERITFEIDQDTLDYSST